jgi:carbamoyltransferase
MQKEQVPFRNVITYHPEWGHAYIKNINARIRHPFKVYFLKTDESGFRNGYQRFKETISGSKKILFLGDSFTAGDGVANEFRFSDQLQSKFDCLCYNAGLAGSGVDQQLLIYQSIKKNIQHDLLVLAPHLDDLNRNMLSSRVGVDRQGGNFVNIPKPYFKLEENKLILNNNPVPRNREHVKKVDPILKENHKLKIKLSQFKSKILNFFNYRVLQKQKNPFLANANSHEWQIMDAIIKSLIQESEGKPIILMPIPEMEHVVLGMKPLYKDLFMRYVDNKQVYFFDVLNCLKKLNKKNQIYLPSCGHFREEAHKAISEFMGMELVHLGIIKAREFPLDYIKPISDNYVLGISCFYHDSAAVLLKNGQLIAAAHEERFSRIKHDKKFPSNAINFCLEEAGVSLDELTGVCYYDDESLTLERAFSNISLLDANSAKQFWNQYQNSLIEKANLAGLIRKNLQITGGIYKTLHHRSHAASAFYPSPFKEAAIIVADGVGEWATLTIAHGIDNSIKLIAEQHYPHSLGLLYSAFTYFCGFKVNSGEYKLMGLAPYGRPLYTKMILDNIVCLKEDGSIQLNMDYFRFQYGEKMTGNQFEELFGVPIREPESRLTQIYIDIAASIQEVTEEIMLKICRHAKKITGSDFLVLAGGVALNCVANGKILKEKIFKDIWIQPASGDAGGALGAALEFYFSPENPISIKNRWAMDHAFWGPSFSNDEINSFLESIGVLFHKFKEGERGNRIASFLNENKVIGHFNGSMEYGPRSLGARSILGNSMDPEGQRKINLKIKYRESFRPFAPAVLEEKVSDYFEIDRPSPYMLLVAPVNKDKRITCDLIITDDLLQIVNQKRSIIPAVTHVDYSARIQSVSKDKDGNTGFYEIIKAFDEISGSPVLINTSFNVRGEPIVCTPFDAYQCFMRTEMDVLVLGDFYLLKNEQAIWTEKNDWQNEFVLD